MTGIPEDIMKTARDVLDRAWSEPFKGDAVAFIAHALHAERKRCARVATTVRTAGCSTPKQAANYIAVAILGGTIE